MKWDDELERLVIQVIETFGHVALNGPIDRALEQAMRARESRPVVDRTSDVDVSGPRLFPSGVLEEALRAELRRLIRPH